MLAAPRCSVHKIRSFHLQLAAVASHLHAAVLTFFTFFASRASRPPCIGVASVLIFIWMHSPSFAFALVYLWAINMAAISARMRVLCFFANQYIDIRETAEWKIKLVLPVQNKLKVKSIPTWGGKVCFFYHGYKGAQPLGWNWDMTKGVLDDWTGLQETK